MTEILSIPEEHLYTVIQIIRTGIKNFNGKLPSEVRRNLLSWCKEEEEYLKNLREEYLDECPTCKATGKGLKVKNANRKTKTVR